MYPYRQTRLEHTTGRFGEIKHFLAQYGFEEGGNWEYDHGFFDRKLHDNPGYLYIRIPCVVMEGAFGQNDALVRLGTPLLLRHKYQRGLDDYVHTHAYANSAFNQFSEPVDEDASLREKDVLEGARVIQHLEQALAQQYPV